MSENAGLHYPIYLDKAPKLTYEQFNNLSWQGLASYWCSRGDDKRLAIHCTETEADVYFKDWRLINILQKRYLSTEHIDNWKEYTSSGMYLVQVKEPENVKFVKKYWQRFFFAKENEKQIYFKGFDKEYDDIEEDNEE